MSHVRRFSLVVYSYNTYWFDILVWGRYYPSSNFRNIPFRQQIMIRRYSQQIHLWWSETRNHCQIMTSRVPNWICWLATFQKMNKVSIPISRSARGGLIWFDLIFFLNNLNISTGSFIFSLHRLNRSRLTSLVVSIFQHDGKKLPRFYSEAPRWSLYRSWTILRFGRTILRWMKPEFYGL